MPTIRQLISTRLRHWLLGPEFVAELQAAVQRLVDLGTQADAAAAQLATGASATTTASPLWVPVPAKSKGRLELLMPQISACGFYIEMNPDPQRHLYQLYTPEGERMAWGCDLTAMKRYGERLARERAEFDAPLPRNVRG